jgi:hypothetical protein
VALFVLAAWATSGCGGASGNGVASKSPTEILAASKAAASAASSVHLKTTTGEVVLDVRLTQTGGSGSLKISALTLELLRIGDVLYVKGTAAAYKQLGITSKVPPQAWVKVPPERSAQLKAFADKSGQLNRLLSLEGPLTKGRTTSVEGQSVVEVKQVKKVYTRTLYVATNGKPYPVEIVLQGQVTGKTTFSEWDKPVTLTAPTNVIDLTRLSHR